jgi:TRAP-type C4-dicarboxylate transport system permease small subunit
MIKLGRIIEPIALAILLIGGLGMIASTFLGTADVVGTQVFGVPVPGAVEITESTMVLIVFGGLTYAQIRRNHIRVELLYLRAGSRGQAAMDILAGLMGLLFFSLLLWQAVNEAIYSLQIDEATFGLIRMPLWPARLILVAGTGLLILQILLDLCADVSRLRKGGEALSAEDLIQREIAVVDTALDKREG